MCVFSSERKRKGQEKKDKKVGKEFRENRESLSARMEEMELGQTKDQSVQTPGKPPLVMLNGIASCFTCQTVSFLSPMTKLLRIKTACESWSPKMTHTAFSHGKKMSDFFFFIPDLIFLVSPLPA